MIKVTILYPLREGARFDVDYYLKSHMPEAIRRLAPALRSVSVDRPLSVGEPWPQPAYAAICTFECDSQAAFEAVFFANAEFLQGDIPAYTDIEPIIQISEVEIAQGAAG